MNPLLPIALLTLCFPLAARADQPPTAADGNAKTHKLDHPARGYPRPMMMRPDWTDLSGPWQHTTTAKDAAAPEEWEGEIQVPTANSPAGHDPDHLLWFRRSFNKPELGAGKRLLLHFESVGGKALLRINGHITAAHHGGGSPFHVDITASLNDSPQQEIVVSTWHPGGRGIDGMVWLEMVPRTHFTSIEVDPDIGTGEVTVLAKIWGQANFRAMEVRALDGEKEVARGKGFYHYKEGGMIARFTIPEPKPWTPDSPKLYGLRIRIANEDGSTHDDVTSYFAMREISLMDDAAGQMRIALNGKPQILLGTRDPRQSSTPIDDAAIRQEIESLKAMGFNLTRLSAGVASSRYYHWADRLGLLVWQDLPSNAKGDQLKRHLEAIRSRYGNHPSIIIWPGGDPAAQGETKFPFTASRPGQGTADLLDVHGESLPAAPDLPDPGEAALAVSGIGTPGEKLALAQYQSRIDQLENLIRAGLSAAVFSDRPGDDCDPNQIAEINAGVFDPSLTQAQKDQGE